MLQALFNTAYAWLKLGVFFVTTTVAIALIYKACAFVWGLIV